MKTLVYIYVAILILIPALRIGEYYWIDLYGTEYKFEVSLYDPRDPFFGRYLSIRSDAITDAATYIIPQTGSNNNIVTSLEYTDAKPSTGEYFKNLSIDRYYMDESYTLTAEELFSKLERLNFNRKIYIGVKVIKGNWHVSGLFVENEAIESFLKGEVNRF
jgi:hypothetical protein